MQRHNNKSYDASLAFSSKEMRNNRKHNIMIDRDPSKSYDMSKVQLRLGQILTFI